MPPMEWHAKLKEAREKTSSSDDPVPIVFDCRNDYETQVRKDDACIIYLFSYGLRDMIMFMQVGKFELAEPLQTENFRDSWDILKEVSSYCLSSFMDRLRLFLPI